MSDEQKKLLLKTRVAVALQNELGRVTKDEEIEQVSRDHNYCKITVEEPRYRSSPRVSVISSKADPSSSAP
jgi:hypothetical protein